jgi:hypothetical protein
MEEAGESRGGRLGEGLILTRRGTVRRLCHHPLLHYCQYVLLDCASGSVSGAKPHVTFQLRGKEKGRGNDVGPTCQRQQPNCNAFSIYIYWFITWLRRHLQPATLELVASFNFNPRRQLHPSSTSILLANFIPRRQLQPSSPPTSTLVAFQIPNLVAFQIPNPVIVLFPPLLLDTRSVLDAAAAR